MDNRTYLAVTCTQRCHRWSCYDNQSQSLLQKDNCASSIPGYSFLVFKCQIFKYRTQLWRKSAQRGTDSHQSSTSLYCQYTHIFPQWRTLNKLHYCSGASYCDIGHGHWTRNDPHPTPEQPLGVDFPGLTYCEPGTPNWVGHLVTEYAQHKEMLVYCYAVGGARVDGVKAQIKQRFLPEVGLKPEWARWSADDTLFGEPKLERYSQCMWILLHHCSDLGWD